MSSHSSYTHMHVQKSPQLPSCGYWTMPSLCLTIQFLTGPLWPDGASLLPAFQWLTWGISCEKTALWSSKCMATLHNTGLERDHHWILLKLQVYHSQHTKQSPSRARHRANTHTLAKGSTRPAFAASTQCLETPPLTLSPKHAVTPLL